MKFLISKILYWMNEWWQKWYSYFLNERERLLKLLTHFKKIKTKKKFLYFHSLLFDRIKKIFFLFIAYNNYLIHYNNNSSSSPIIGSLNHLNFRNNSVKEIPEKTWPVMNALLSLDLAHNEIENNLPTLLPVYISYTSYISYIQYIIYITYVLNVNIWFVYTSWGPIFEIMKSLRSFWITSCFKFSLLFLSGDAEKIMILEKRYFSMALRM